MKKLLLTLLLFGILNSFSQITNPLDTQLSFINQSTVTSGMIYERSMRTTNLFAFNQPSNLHNTADYSFFKQVLGELYKSSNNSRLISNAELENRNVSNANISNEVNIGIINSSLEVMNYDSTNAANAGLTFDGNYYRHITGKVPFYSLQALVIAPLKNTVQGSSITYKFDNNLILNNGSYTIKTLVANFGEGVNRTIISNYILTNSTVTVPNVLSNITQKISFSVTLSNDINITTYGKIFVSKKINTDVVARIAPNGENDNIENLYPINNLLESEENAYLGLGETIAVKGKLEVRIFYSPNNLRVLRKPIIIIDGFDPGDNRKITDADCANDPTGLCQYYNKNLKIAGEPYDPEIHKSIVEKMTYKTESGTYENLISKLQGKGFDVIVVNMPYYLSSNRRIIDGGADFIERNALTLVTLIKKLNQKLDQNGSAEKIVIVGPSMGGQISRYALAFMEKKQSEVMSIEDKKIWNHNTRLWVAFDSPNHGANVPFGDQALINILRDGGANNDVDKQYKSKLNSTASKQQLIELHQQTFNEEHVNQSYLNGSTIAQGMPTNSGNPYFQSHYSNQFNNGLPNSKGFPMNLRKIAIVNGSLTGVRPIGSDSQLMLDARLSTQHCYRPFRLLGFGPSICYTTKLATAQASLLATTGVNNEVASLKKLTLHGQFTRVTNMNNRGNLDLVPGGLIDATQVIHDGITGASLKPRSFFGYPGDYIGYTYYNIYGNGTQWETRALIPNQCFIPTFSGIGIKNPNQNWANPLNRNLVCSNETYFDSYFGENENTEHIELNYRSVKWLMKELGDNTTPPIPQAPSYPLEANLLTGPSVICENTNTTFSFPDICKLPSAATWTITANAQIISQTGYSVLVKGISTGFAILTATFHNGQIMNIRINVKEAVSIIPSNFAYSASINGQWCDSKWHYVEICFPSQVGIDRNLFVSSPNLGSEPSQNLGCVIYKFGKGYSGQFVFDASFTNGCGDYLEYASDDWPPLMINNCNQIGQGNRTSSSNQNSYFYKTYPNPTNNIINIELKNSEEKPDDNSIIFAELYNMMGEVKRNVTVNNNIATIDVIGLPTGIYVLKININGIIESHQVAIE